MRQINEIINDLAECLVLVSQKENSGFMQNVLREMGTFFKNEPNLLTEENDPDYFLRHRAFVYKKIKEWLDKKNKDLERGIALDESASAGRVREFNDERDDDVDHDDIVWK